jgi:hypothetical protein
MCSIWCISSALIVGIDRGSRTSALRVTAANPEEAKFSELCVSLNEFLVQSLEEIGKGGSESGIWRRDGGH